MRNIGETLNLPETTTFAGRLKYLRALRGITQAQLAARLSKRVGSPVNVMTVNRWEVGKNEPLLPRVSHIAKVLGASVPWLIEGTGKAPE